MYTKDRIKSYVTRQGVENPEATVIICSVKPEMCRECVENIRHTIGVRVEFLVVDNREAKLPIAQAYNLAASMAASEALLMLHEDVLFENIDWGKPLVGKLNEENTGVVGFIGTTFRTDAYCGWNNDHNVTIGNITFIQNGRRFGFRNEPWEAGQKYSKKFYPALLCDGLGMCVPKRVWEKIPFDEEALTGFHCYDIDYCLSVSQFYQNYIYVGADICHFSNGSLNEQWAETTIRLTDGKWSGMLPAASGSPLPDNSEEIAARVSYDFVYKLIRDINISDATAKAAYTGYKRRCDDHPEMRKHLATLRWQYLMKRVLKLSPLKERE